MAELSNREREVLALLATTATGREIQDQLCISPSTLGAHFRHIADKICTASRGRGRTRVEVVIRAMQMGLVVLQHQHDFVNFRQCRACGYRESADGCP